MNYLFRRRNILTGKTTTDTDAVFKCVTPGGHIAVFTFPDEPDRDRFLPIETSMDDPCVRNCNRFYEMWSVPVEEKT